MMLALELYRSWPKHLAATVLGHRVPPILTGTALPLRLIRRPEPRLPERAGWVRLSPRLSGISGADLAQVSGRASPYFSPLMSLPLVPGHQVVASLDGDCADLPAGTRVVIDPVLSCAARGIGPCGNCAAQRTNRCDHVSVGKLSPGALISGCRDTGGGWGTSMVAHRSQLYPVPDDLPDEAAVLVEPLARAVHTVRQARVAAADHILVSGASSTGLLTLFALRQLTEAGTVTMLAEHPSQTERALALGASQVVPVGDACRFIRRATQAFQLEPDGGSAFLLGGVDLAIATEGDRDSLDAALRLTRAGGRVLVAGLPTDQIDLSPVWFRELELVGSYAAPAEPTGAGELFSPAAAGTRGQTPFETAVALAGSELLRGIVGARYHLRHWRQALDHAQTAARSGTAKVAFDLTGDR